MICPKCKAKIDRPSIRETVEAIPVQPMLRAEDGKMIELRITCNKKGLYCIMGLKDGVQYGESREPIADPIDLIPYLVEVVSHLRRS
jgi:hypothetical protein